MLVAALAAVRIMRRPTSVRLPRTVVAAILILIGANVASLPFVWHVRAFGWILGVRLRMLAAKLGLKRMARHENSAADLPIALSPFPAIGQSPFDLKMSQRRTATFASADFNMHVSNSCYSAQLDFARSRFWIECFGAVLKSHRIYVPLASIAHTFVREIPLGAAYEVETSIAAWDTQWLYFAHLFRLCDSKRTVAAVSLSKTCLKLAGHRLSIAPGKVMVLAGFGTDTGNWTRARKTSVRDQRAFLTSDVSDGLEMLEDRRQRGLAAIEALGIASSKVAWLALADL